MLKIEVIINFCTEREKEFVWNELKSIIPKNALSKEYNLSI